MNNTGDLTLFSNLIQNIGDIIAMIVPILITLAVAWFIWNVIKYAIAGDEGKKSEARSQMIWGIIALAVIVSMWGLVYWLQDVFGVDSASFNQVLPGGADSLIP